MVVNVSQVNALPTREADPYVNSNSKMLAAARDANKLKMFAWEIEDV
jgi:hypothetical protein